jgi:hypothetical protein
MARFFRAAIFVAFFLYAGNVFAAGGTCPNGANYLSSSMDALRLPLVTLNNLGVTNCYFIAASGSDSNTGTDEEHPWAHLPGMSTCTGNCAAHTPAAGDGYIFRGGDTWQGSNLGIYWHWSGTTSNPVYIGVDPTWSSGGSWSRPIWTCGGAACSGGSSGYFWQSPTNVSHYILDDIELTGLVDSGNAPNYVNLYGTYNTAERLYIHGWRTTRNDNSPSQAFGMAAGAPNQGATLRYNVIDGADTAQNMMFVTHSGTPIAYGNVIYNVYTGLDGCGDDWHDNLLDNAMVQGVVTGHQDGLYHVTQCYNSSSLIYNNVIRNTTNPLTGGAVKLWLNGNAPCPFSSCTSYMFNNIIYNTYPGNTFDTGGHFAQNYGTWYIFNNTIDCGTDSVQGDCSELSDRGNTGGTMTLIRLNNQYISTGSLSNDCTHYTCSQTGDLVQSLSSANAQGYSSTSPFAFQPTSASAPTITAAAKVTTAATRLSLCTTIGAIDASAGAACQSDTTYACTYETPTHDVRCPARSTVARAAEPNIGAYQFTSSIQGSSPEPPLGLTVSVQ